MKSLIIILLVMLITSSSLSIAKEKPAKIKFSELKHDFGKVQEGDELSYSFKFKNTGSGNLVIESVNAACGCTGVTVGDKKEYKKNEKGEIKVSFNTRGREGMQTKSVTVKTNDPGNPEIVLTFSCEVKIQN